MATGLLDSLPDNMTPDDMEKLVDALTEEDRAEREEAAAAAGNGEAEKAAATKTKTATKTPAGEESSAGKSTAEAEEAPEDDKAGETEEAEGEDQGDEVDADRKWFDDDLKAEVSAAGFDEDQFAEFASRDEVERALNLMDLQAMQHGRKAEAEGKEVDGQKTPAADSPRPASKTPPETAGDEGSTFDVGIEEYEEPVREAISRLAVHFEQRLEKRISGLEAAEKQRTQAAEEAAFDVIVDSLGHKDLFGETGKETPGQLKHREQLLGAKRVLQVGLEGTGRKAMLEDALVGRALRLEFADHISKSERIALTRKVKAQSDQKRGIGATRTEDRDGGETVEEFADRRYRELDDDS